MMSREKQLKIKRAFDIIFSLFIIMFFPVWIAIAIAIKLSSKGPVFFLQDRPGKNKNIFKIFKFRTMKPGSEKMVKGIEVMKDDDRVTSIGKLLRRTKVDEIPQVINVLKGDMSVIGPRPERIDYLNDYDEEASKRFYMRPGMTGLTQVNGNIYISIEDRNRLDVHYVENFSLKLDAYIFLKTFGVIVLGEDVFANKSKFPLFKD